MKSYSNKSKSTLTVVGIGASAGGLEAVISLLSGMPLNTGLAFVVVQHLEPTHPSLSVEIISRSTKLKIEEVKNGVRVKPNHVYFIPPNRNMTISSGVLKLSARNKLSRKNMTIDLFMKSLAISKNKLSIGIILSGTGTDGTLGLKEIQAQGGITFVQDPKSAKFPAMPQNAIDARVANFILTPEKMIQQMIRKLNILPPQKSSTPITRTTNSQESPLPISTEQDRNVQSHQELAQVLDFLKNQMKVDFSDYKQSTIRRRIQRRMTASNTKNFATYYQYLVENSGEASILYNDLLINVTEFFREPDSFKALESRAFATFIKNRPDQKPIRIWVPGCSTGEEAYSIAILLVEFLERVQKSFPIQIFATDLSEKMVHLARMGHFSESACSKISQERLDRFFNRDRKSGYKISAKIRELCVFSLHDVINDPPFANLDLISCRNVLIYFSSSLQKRIFPIFHFGLQPNGFLWLGKSENLGDSPRFFDLVDKKHKIFSRSNVKTPLNFKFLPRRNEDPLKNTEKIPMGPIIRNDYQKDADHLLLAQFSPPGFIIDEECEILQFRGKIAPYIEPSKGTPSLNLFKMVRSELLIILRSAVQYVKKNNKKVVKKSIQLIVEGKQVLINLEVHPTNKMILSKDRTYLILFIESKKIDSDAKSSQKNSRGGLAKETQMNLGRRIKELQFELSQSRDYQQSIIEQYEATQEELTSANEELQSTNEEFLSSNEEIETAKEELQSTNEELVTVNDELQMKNSELTTLSSDLKNLLTSVEIPVVIVGSDHRIRVISSKAKTAFNLIPSDIGRPIEDIKPNFKLNLGKIIETVSASLSPLEVEVQDGSGSWMRVQVRPYYTVDNRVDGAIIALVDINDLKMKEEKIVETLENITSIAAAVPLPLAVVNRQFLIQSENQAFYRYFKFSNQNQNRELFSILNLDKIHFRQLSDLLSKAILLNEPFHDYEVECEVPLLGKRIFHLSGGKINWKTMELEAVLLSFLDITKQRFLEEERKGLLKFEQEARQQADRDNLAKDVFLATLSHELRTPLSPILTWSQMINRGNIDFEQAKKGAAVIEQCAKTQSQLIDDLLDISRIISGKLILNTIDFHLGPVIESAIESVRTLANKKLLTLEFDLKKCRQEIHGDPVRLQQILWNLLTNAIKFSNLNGVVSVEVNSYERSRKSFVEIKVLDQGKGIPPAFLHLIFERFTQADGTSTRVHGGLGLGLSIVKNLVEMHNGTVRADNLPEGKGAVFTITLPVNQIQKIISEQTVVRDQKQYAEKLAGEQVVQSNLDNLRILLVDDDEVSRTAISMFLHGFGAVVLSVGSAKEALDSIAIFKPQVLLSDLAMPEIDGYSLIKLIRNLDSDEQRNLPAVALSAYATIEDSAKSLSAGFQAHLAKPVDTMKLAQTLTQVSKHS